MTTDPSFDFALQFAQNFADFSFYAVLGALAGAAFPCALLLRRALARSLVLASRSEELRRGLFLLALVLACGAVPWSVLWLGRWHDGGPVEPAHALTMIACSLATISLLLRRWRLFGAPQP
jgi:hypothetical protein